MKTGLGEFTAKVGRDYIFKPTTWNKSLHQESNDNDVRIPNFATTKNYLLGAGCSRTEAFINTTVPILTGRLTTRLITY
jgi:hypothetical protein